MSLEDQIRIHHEGPPFKKCKLTPLSSPETNLALLQEQNENKILILKTPEINIPNPKTTSFSESRNPWIVSSSLVTKSSALRSAYELGYFFTSCVNFLKASTFSAVEDIDWMIKYITMNGRVQKIQHHWSIPGPKQQWLGAMVIYKSQDDCQQVMKRLHVDKFACLNYHYIPNHLKLIGQMEDRLLKSLDPEYRHRGTTVTIFGIQYRSPSSGKLKQEMEQYGDVLSFGCVQDNQDRKYEVWEVTYQYTVEAIAAVLGMDGKFHYRNRLRALLQMGEKERKLNLLVAGHC